MKTCADDMLMVTVYKSTVPEYRKLDWDDPFFNAPDNMMEVEIPRNIVEMWYNGIADDVDGVDFDDWFFNESTADDTDGLVQFAIDHGFRPDVPKPRKYSVELSATYEIWAFDEDTAADMAQRQHFRYNDYGIYVDGKCYS